MDGEGPRIAINGFGRIGRLVARILLQMDKPVDLVAVNDLTPNATLAHLFRYDSVHGRYAGRVEVTDDGLVIDGDRLRVLAVKDPAQLPWKALEPDIVVEASGKFRDRAGLAKHIEAGAKRVLLTAPGKDMDATIVPGVNDDVYDPAKHTMVSLGSCTTNALAPVLKVLHDHFGVGEAMMTTVHAVTADQNLVDGVHTDLRRARASMLSMIPTETGAAKAISLVMPHLKGRLHGMSIRVPTQDVSVIDLVARVRDAPDVAGLRRTLCDEADGRLRGILGCEADPLVSIDFTSDPRSSIVDLPSLAVQGQLVKVLSWYDNEWGYAHRIAETAHKMAGGA